MGVLDLFDPNSYIPKNWGKSSAESAGQSIERASSNAAGALEDVSSRALDFLGPLVGPAADLTKAASNATTVISYTKAFSNVVHCGVDLYQACTDEPAREELSKFENAIVSGNNVAADSMKSSATTLKKISNQAQQGNFSKLVYNFVAMESESAYDDVGVFVFHPGTDWYPGFWELLRDRPLERLHGVFCDVNAMMFYLKLYREAAGKGRKLLVLFPANDTILLAQPIELFPELRPITFTGHLRNNSEPYVFANIPAAQPWEFRHVMNVRRTIEEPEGQARLEGRQGFNEKAASLAKDTTASD
ncbi:hypothetical protein H2203_007982 [Taxawa tesnikishii (nom. ined.)]|nr:hypothetical protein H2203_007982 [Dothideales sp. JES 119]